MARAAARSSFCSLAEPSSRRRQVAARPACLCRAERREILTTRWRVCRPQSPCDHRRALGSASLGIARRVSHACLERRGARARAPAVEVKLHSPAHLPTRRRTRTHLERDAAQRKQRRLQRLPQERRGAAARRRRRLLRDRERGLVDDAQELPRDVGAQKLVATTGRRRGGAVRSNRVTRRAVLALTAPLSHDYKCATPPT